MVSRDFETLNKLRLDRAGYLSSRYPASRGILSFFIELVTLQKKIVNQLDQWDSLIDHRDPFLKLVAEKGPPELRNAGKRIDKLYLNTLLDKYWKQVDTSSSESFFARVLLQPYLIKTGVQRGSNSPNKCPSCGHFPQVGVLRPEGDGMKLTLVCSLCLKEWSFPRGYCPACQESEEKKRSYFKTTEFKHFQLEVCETCHIYLHTVDLDKDPKAIPEVDELTALPLDIWAQQRGYRKLQVNLAGI
jgi:FdhE protein